MADEINLEKLQEAENYCLQATFILHSLQANIQVYGSNSAFTGASPADVDLALQYIDRSLEYFPDNVNYLNLKALLLGEGKGQKVEAIALLERAQKISPRDINVENNLKVMKSQGCFVATAAFGSEFGVELDTFRWWRGNVLLQSRIGRQFVRRYYQFGPAFAAALNERPWLKPILRSFLSVFASALRRRYGLFGEP